ncbi:MAG TPA: DUF6036 family nucleotidyltransferase, partial [Anaerolineales bacterium]|nr:DUF6036 family nucleotidyltransferase [Anaerolineales bacterium]
MNFPGDLASLIEPLLDLQRLLNKYGERGVIIGGIASGFLGRPRLTVDLDAMFIASVQDTPKILNLAKEVGIEPRVENAMEFAKSSRVLLLQHTKSGINIDISLGILPFEEEVVERGILYDAGPVIIRLPTPEDLVILKAVAHRPKDLQDIRE